jgi:hypothetical protein
MFSSYILLRLCKEWSKISSNFSELCALKTIVENAINESCPHMVFLYSKIEKKSEGLQVIFDNAKTWKPFS